jgi:hypothetical protein
MSRPQEPAARTDDNPFALKWGLSANQADVLRQRKYSVMHGNSDWVIGTADQECRSSCFAGWPATCVKPKRYPAPKIDNWLVGRKAAVSKRFQRCA